MSTGMPPSPIWQDDTSGLAVWVNGAMIEITIGDPDFTRITADEAAPLPAAFAQAIEEARAWAARWDGHSRSYARRAAS